MNPFLTFSSPIFLFVCVCTIFISNPESKAYGSVTLIREALPENKTVRDFRFGVAQFDPHGDRNCIQTCRSLGPFDTCDFPLADYRIPGFLVTYDKFEYKNEEMLISGYALIPNNSKAYCYCHEQDTKLYYADPYEELPRQFQAFMKSLEKTDEVVLQFKRTKLRKTKIHRRMYDEIENFYHFHLLPLYSWSKDDKRFFKRSPIFQAQFLKSLLEEFRDFEEGWHDLISVASQYLCCLDEARPLRMLMYKNPLLNYLTIFEVLQHRLQQDSTFAVEYHKCGSISPN